MRYREWDIQAHAYYTGFAAEYTSPTGRSYRTAACFATPTEAVAYAQSLVDYLVRCERLVLEERHQPTLAS
jgi:hypothetical protein